MKRVVITGVGVIASCGIGKEAFWDALARGISGVKPVSLFDTAQFSVKQAGEARDFDPALILGPKGMRTFDRSTRLACSAAKLALDDAHLTVSAENAQDIGMVAGTSLGSIHSIVEFDRVSITEGPQAVNPSFFSNTVINSPASQVSIKFGIKGLNSTIATGFCSGLDAIGYAAHCLRLGKVKAVLAGGIEELCVETYLGLYKTRCLAGVSGGVELSCPFDTRRNGLVLGEGAALLLLEDLESAKERNAPIYAEVKGYGQGFDIVAPDGFDYKGAGLKKAMGTALAKAGLAAENIGYISAAANSSVAVDKIEACAIGGVFGGAASQVPVGAIKSMLGETVNAAGSMQVAAALCALARQVALPTINYERPDAECALNHVTNQARACTIQDVLVNAFGPGGSSASMVISKYRG